MFWNFITRKIWIITEFIWNLKKKLFSVENIVDWLMKIRYFLISSSENKEQERPRFQRFTEISWILFFQNIFAS